MDKKTIEEIKSYSRAHFSLEDNDATPEGIREFSENMVQMYLTRVQLDTDEIFNIINELWYNMGR